jgi:hypothetical protein
LLERSEQRQTGQREGDSQSSALNLARLSPHLLELGFARNGLGSPVHVALTARREADSRLPCGLKNATGAKPEGEDKRHTPEPLRMRLE